VKPGGGRGFGSAAKSVQAKPSKNAWIWLVLFVRIGTFQRVTAEKNKKNPISFPSETERSQEPGFGRASEKSIARISVLRKWIAGCHVVSGGLAYRAFDAPNGMDGPVTRQIIAAVDIVTFQVVGWIFAVLRGRDAVVTSLRNLALLRW
jgi:hypothetical protein